MNKKNQTYQDRPPSQPTPITRELLGFQFQSPTATRRPDNLPRSAEEEASLRYYTDRGIPFGAIPSNIRLLFHQRESDAYLDDGLMNRLAVSKSSEKCIYLIETQSRAFILHT